MKKRNKIFLGVFAALAIAVMLPMGNVQALNRKPVMRMEIETEPKSSEPEEEEPENTEQEREEPESEAEEPDLAKENDTMEETVYSPQKDIAVEIEDDIQQEFVYMDETYVKNVTHKITLTNQKSDFSDTDIYENISYVIYQKTNQGDIRLKEDFLEIPAGAGDITENTIETAYTQVGAYCIRVQGEKNGGQVDELICHDFLIAKDTRTLSLHSNMPYCYYGDTLYIDELVEENGQYPYQDKYEITQDCGEQKKIMEIETEGERPYIKAVGFNQAYGGSTTLKIRLRETEYSEASNEETLILHVKPVVLDMEVQTDTSSVYLYDTFTVKVRLRKDEKDVTEELFGTDKNLRVKIGIMSEKGFCEIISKEAVSNIPVNPEYFKEFSKGAKYKIWVTLLYEGEEEYFPYIVDTSVKELELLGRRAVIKLSAGHDGIFDYRTYYQGTTPVLRLELEDVTETPDKVPPVEAERIPYHITFRDKGIVSIDNPKQYTAADGTIPLSINGIGKTTLTVTAGENDVYTVESSEIDIEVKHSPLYDEDFAVSVSDADGTNEHVFKGDGSKTGFEKWQEYLDARNGWINKHVKISLTEEGIKRYNQIYLRKGMISRHENPVYMNTESDVQEHIFGASNILTGANTEKADNRNNRNRCFKMGIDMTPPTITNFHASTDYYAPTSTEERQYFPQDFVLTGSFADTGSGVAAIEYTTDINAENGSEWIALETEEGAGSEKSFKLVLGDGVYNAIAVRAVDTAGNVSSLACLKTEKGASIKIIVDTSVPEIHVSAAEKTEDDIWHEYSADNENWTNREIRFQVSEKENGENYAGIHQVEYAYQSIAAALCNEPIAEDKWQPLAVDERGIAELSVGGECQNPENKNGYYYFRGVSSSGVKSDPITEKRILLWQKMTDKEPAMESGVNPEKRYNEWYNKESGTPVIDFAYPKYDTGVISGEYAAPVTIHYNLNVKNEKDSITSLADDKTASIHVDFSPNNPLLGFPVICDDITQLQAKLSDDGIYTLEYWMTDAAGNKSETEILTYKVDCHEPDALNITLDGEELPVGNEDVPVYEKFYQNSVSGETSAEYGISGKESIKLLKAKTIGEWNNMKPTEDAEQFQLEPNIRCLLYVRAVDGAGNMAEGWTPGIVVDNEAPTGEGTPQFIIEPEGANKHGFFNKDVKVKISIKDAPSDGNSAGLKLVTASAGTDNGNTMTDKELFSSAQEHVSESLITETEGFCIVETIEAKVNEGNHAYVTVNATDRCGNTSTDTREFQIDVTKPEIEITFDNDNALNGRYFNAGRRAKINIEEVNFDASLVVLEVTRNGEDFTPSISEWQSDKNNHYAYVDFSADGDYTLTVECRDLADNKADKESAEPFTIDKTIPEVEITLENSSVQNGYFNEKQTAVITVTEHNFNEEDFYIWMQPAGKAGLWEHKNDTHVIKVDFLSEGEYAVSCDYNDLAGNEISDEDKAKMPMEFVIDMTNPVIEISGVENNSANAGSVTPNIMVRDAYIEPKDVTISLTTGRGLTVDISSDIATTLTDGGFLYTLNGLDAKPDDIYYLTVNAADKAGNISELTYRFSLNRRGSTYDLTDLARFKDSYYNSYKNLEDIKIVEMNVDKVEDFALYLSHNANIIYGKSGSRVLALDERKLQEAVLYNVDVSGSENTGYVYTYTIYRENFAREGTYRMGIYSKDAAGNEVNNLLEQNGEEIQFVIDNTIPRVVIDGVENNEIYDVESQEVRVVADDNFRLAEAELMLVNQDGDVLERWNYFDIVENEGDTAVVVIGEHSEEVSLLYRAVDAAGNEVRTLQGEKEAKSDFLVTTDKFVQLVNKPVQTPIGRVIMVSLVCSLIGIGLVLVIIKKSVLKKTAKKRK